MLNDDDLCNVIVTAFESGIDYWAHRAVPMRLCKADGPTKTWRPMTGEEQADFSGDGLVMYAKPNFWADQCNGYVLYCDGHGLADRKMLTKNKLLAGLEAMEEASGDDTVLEAALKRLKTPGEYDAADADLAIQFALFGEVIYG